VRQQLASARQCTMESADRMHGQAVLIIAIISDSGSGSGSGSASASGSGSASNSSTGDPDDIKRHKQQAADYSPRHA
jgi:hypothetical protein